MRIRLLATVAMAVLACGRPALADPSGPEVATPFLLTPHGGIIVEATVDGHGPFRLMIDTGSTHSIMTTRVADVLRARPVAKAIVSSATGPVMAPVIAVGSLQVGPVRVAVMPSVVASLPIGDEADGLIGQDVLGGQRYTIDYRRRVIVWYDASAETPAALRDGLDVNVVGGRFVVDALVEDRSVPLVLDTGSEALVLFGPSGLPGSDGLRGNGATLGAVGGPTAVAVEVVGRVRIGDVEQRAVPMVRVGRDAGGGVPGGLLPMHGFARVTVDGPGRRVVLEVR